MVTGMVWWGWITGCGGARGPDGGPVHSAGGPPASGRPGGPRPRPRPGPSRIPDTPLWFLSPWSDVCLNHASHLCVCNLKVGMRCHFPMSSQSSQMATSLGNLPSLIFSLITLIFDPNSTQFWVCIAEYCVLPEGSDGPCLDTWSMLRPLVEVAKVDRCGARGGGGCQGGGVRYCSRVEMQHLEEVVGCVLGQYVCCCCMS